MNKCQINSWTCHSFPSIHPPLPPEALMRLPIPSAPRLIFPLEASWGRERRTDNRIFWTLQDGISLQASDPDIKVGQGYRWPLLSSFFFRRATSTAAFSNYFFRFALPKSVISVSFMHHSTELRWWDLWRRLNPKGYRFGSRGLPLQH